MKSFQNIWTNMKPEEKQALADAGETTVNYLGQIAHQHRNAGRELIKRLCKADPRLHPVMFL